MGKYVFIYYAGDSDGGDNEAWGKWFGELGDKLVDGGNPFDNGAQAVTKDGIMPVNNPPATGYSIVEADSKDEAVKLAKGSPLLGSKDAAVCVYEALPM